MSHDLVNLIIALAAFCTGYGLGVLHNAVDAIRDRANRTDTHDRP